MTEQSTTERTLGSLLRGFRESVEPRDVGLPPGGRRRTPGLRRAELAVLAGVSVEYLTRLEQGRDRRPSPAVLGAVADALRLGADERGILLLASKAAGGAATCMATPEGDVPATVLAVLDRLAPAPAAVLDRYGEVLACTPAYRELYAASGLFDLDRPLQARFVLTDPRARALHPDWDAVADRVVADLQRFTAPTDPGLVELTGALSVVAGAAFTDRWSRPLADAGRRAVVRMDHPRVGSLRLEPQALQPAGDQHRRIELLLPGDPATERALDELVTPVRDLRVVRSSPEGRPGDVRRGTRAADARA